MPVTRVPKTKLYSESQIARRDERVRKAAYEAGFNAGHLRGLKDSINNLRAYARIADPTLKEEYL